MRVSFTGTRQGMSFVQRQQFEEWLKANGANVSLFVHGGCVGADIEAHSAVRYHFGKKIFITCLPSDSAKTSRVPRDCGHVGEPKSPRIRDRDIVDLGDNLLIAAPLTDAEVVRSGTWTTVRYARKKKVPVLILGRDG